MTTTLAMKLDTKCPRYPDGIMQLTVSEEDVHWIEGLLLHPGAGGHPSTKGNGEEYESLAARVMREHGIPVPDGKYVCRIDTSRPNDVSHENICVPLACVQHHLPQNHGARSITLKDYLALFSIHRPSVPKEDPVYVPVVDVDTLKQHYLIADKEDEDWLTGQLVRFNEKGFPMINAEWGKWTPLMFEQARRLGAKEMEDPVVFHLKEKEPRDVRKYYIAIVTKDRLHSLASI